MLAIQQSSARSKRKCTPNVLPCKINHNGAVDCSKRYWNPRMTSDGKSTAYFRGRKLYARASRLPEGYRGVVLSSTDRVLPRPQQEKDEEEEDEEGEKEEEVKVLEEQAEFEDVMVWGHEVVVDASEDCYIRGVEEWIGFAESIHSYEDALTKGKE